MIICSSKLIRCSRPRERLVEVGAIIAAPGFRGVDPTAYDTYGYSRYANVVTSLEFERFLSASGPTKGYLVRPSDHVEPGRIAWIQCVGSRDLQCGLHPYCSAVCCMYAVKEAVIAKEHIGAELNTTIFFVDMRTHGKDFEKYYQRAVDEYGVRFIRSRIHTVEEVGDSGDLRITYCTESGNLISEIFNMVVLSVGMEVSESAKELAERLEIEIDDNRFAKHTFFSPWRQADRGFLFVAPIKAPRTSLNRLWKPVLRLREWPDC